MWIGVIDKGEKVTEGDEEQITTRTACTIRLYDVIFGIQ
jgi:hypothetical protein